jgi:hypothetical protein
MSDSKSDTLSLFLENCVDILSIGETVLPILLTIWKLRMLDFYQEIETRHDKHTDLENFAIKVLKSMVPR